MWRAMSLTQPGSSGDQRGLRLAPRENCDGGVGEDDSAMCDRSLAGDGGWYPGKRAYGSVSGQGRLEFGGSMGDVEG